MVYSDLGNAQYRVYDGDNNLLAESPLVNQQAPGLPPKTVDGAVWYNVASICVPNATAPVRVEMTTPDVVGEVMADAVRLVGNVVQIQSLQKTCNEADGTLSAATATVSVEFP